MILTKTDKLILMISCLPILLMGITSLPGRLKSRRIKAWRKALRMDKHQAVHQELFKTIDGYALSRQARTAQDAIEYTYGEVIFSPFIALMSLVHPDSDTVFYDLGSGTGKAVLAFAMIFPVKKCAGVEIFAPLHKTALHQKMQLEQRPEYAVKSKTIEFYCDNFLDVDLNDATLLFINASALIGETWEALNLKLEPLSTCRTVITTTKPLTNKAFSLKKTTALEMSWGVVMAYIHARE